MKSVKEAMLLYAVTDRSWIGEQTLYEQVELALKGGATCIQLREKELDEQAFLQEAREVIKLCHKYEVPLIINDNLEVAIAAQADGIHVGQDDLSIAQVKARIPKNMLVGVSVHNLEEAEEAIIAGADYLGVGAVFPTTTKLDAQNLTLEAIREICDYSKVPVVAIGGISQNNLPKLTGLGLAGVAIVSAIFSAPDIQSETVALKNLTKKVLGKC